MAAAAVLPSLPSLPSLRSHEFKFLTESTFLDSLCPPPMYPHPSYPHHESTIALSQQQLQESLLIGRRLADQTSPASVGVHFPKREPGVPAPKRPRLSDAPSASRPAAEARAARYPQASEREAQLGQPESWTQPLATRVRALSPAYLAAGLTAAAHLPSAALYEQGSLQRTAGLTEADLFPPPPHADYTQQTWIEPRRKRSSSYPESPFSDPLYLSTREASECLRDSLRSESSIEERLQPNFPFPGIPAGSWRPGPALEAAVPPHAPVHRANPSHGPAGLGMAVNLNNVEACLDQLQTSHTFPCNLQLSLSPMLWRDFQPPNALMAHIGLRICEVASETSFHRSLYNSMNPRVVVSLMDLILPRASSVPCDPERLFNTLLANPITACSHLEMQVPIEV